MYIHTYICTPIKILLRKSLIPGNVPRSFALRNNA